jgi:tRNA pseudouridine38-40 synthase
MRNIRLTISYDGTNYAGWQFQKNAPTIQDTIQRALKKITGKTSNLIASGRTDAGVHAEAQIANFRTHSKIPLDKLQMALNSALPKDIVITAVKEARERFNSQHDAKTKLYRYTICNNNFIDPFMRRYAARVFYKLNIDSMKKAARLLEGRHDFRSFQTQDGPSARSLRSLAQGRGEQGIRKDSKAAPNHGEGKDSIRRIYHIKVEKTVKLVYIYIKADGFLYNMARSIAGILVESGRGKIRPSDVKKILSGRDRRHCGPTMPSKGLCLVKVGY